MAEAARLQEAEKHIKTAQKKVKKGLTKWNISQQDYDTAAMEYEAAAKIYQHMKKTEAAIDAWEKAADHHEKAGTLYHSGQAYDKIGVIHKDCKDGKKQAEAIKRAAEYYHQDGKPDRYAQNLVQAAKVLNDMKEHEAAAQLILPALDALEASEQWHYMPDPGRTLVSIRLKQAAAGSPPNYRPAIDAIKRCIKHFTALGQPHNVHKACLEITILTLACNDQVLAEREFDALSSQHGEFVMSEESCAGRSLLDAWESGDHDAVKEVMKQQIFTFLHPDVTRLSRKLQPSGVPKPKPKHADPSGADGEAPPVEEPPPDDDDDMAGLQ